MVSGTVMKGDIFTLFWGEGGGVGNNGPRNLKTGGENFRRNRIILVYTAHTLPILGSHKKKFLSWI